MSKRRKIFLLVLGIVCISSFLLAIFFQQSNTSVTRYFVTNLSSNSATVVWISDKPNVSEIMLVDENNPDNLFSDDRDSEKTIKRYTHHVTLRNLEPEKEYKYKIRTGILNYSNELIFNTIAENTTFALPDPIYGLVKNINNNDGVVLIRKISGETVTSSQINENGSYSIDKNLLGVVATAKELTAEIYFDKEVVEPHNYQYDYIKPLETIVYETYANKELGNYGLNNLVNAQTSCGSGSAFYTSIGVTQDPTSIGGGDYCGSSNKLYRCERSGCCSLVTTAPNSTSGTCTFNCFIASAGSNDRCCTAGEASAQCKSTGVSVTPTATSTTGTSDALKQAVGAECLSGDTKHVVVSETNYPEVNKHLDENNWNSSSNEDIPISIGGGNTVYWNDRIIGTTGSVYANVCKHEKVHAKQASNGTDVASYIWGDDYLDRTYSSYTPKGISPDKCFQGLIEGFAESSDSGGATVGASYGAYRDFYSKVKTWCQSNSCSSDFNSAVWGSYSSYLKIQNLYSEKGQTDMSFTNTRPDGSCTWKLGMTKIGGGSAQSTTLPTSTTRPSLSPTSSSSGGYLGRACTTNPDNANPECGGKGLVCKNSKCVDLNNEAYTYWSKEESDKIGRIAQVYVLPTGIKNVGVNKVEGKDVTVMPHVKKVLDGYFADNELQKFLVDNNLILKLTYGYRSYDEQAKVRAQRIAATGCTEEKHAKGECKIDASKPGKSQHQGATAVDIQGVKDDHVFDITDYPKIIQIAQKYGMVHPLGSDDPPHFYIPESAAGYTGGTTSEPPVDNQEGSGSTTSDTITVKIIDAPSGLPVDKIIKVEGGPSDLMSEINNAVVNYGQFLLRTPRISEAYGTNFGPSSAGRRLIGESYPFPYEGATKESIARYEKLRELYQQWRSRKVIELGGQASFDTFYNTEEYKVELQKFLSGYGITGIGSAKSQSDRGICGCIIAWDGRKWVGTDCSMVFMSVDTAQINHFNTQRQDGDEGLNVLAPKIPEYPYKVRWGFDITKTIYEKTGWPFMRGIEVRWIDSTIINRYNVVFKNVDGTETRVNKQNNICSLNSINTNDYNIYDPQNLPTPTPVRATATSAPRGTGTPTVQPTSITGGGIVGPTRSDHATATVRPTTKDVPSYEVTYKISKGWNLINIPKATDFRSAEEFVAKLKAQGVNVYHIGKFVDGKSEVITFRESGNVYGDKDSFADISNSPIFTYSIDSKDDVSINVEDTDNQERVVLTKGWNVVGIDRKGLNLSLDEVYKVINEQGSGDIRNLGYLQEGGTYKFITYNGSVIYGNDEIIMNKTIDNKLGMIIYSKSQSNIYL